MDKDPTRKNVALQGAAVAAATIALAAACSTGAEHEHNTPTNAPSERPSTPATASTSPKALGSIATRLIFASDRSGNYELYEKNLLSGKLTALTSGPSNSMNPEASPDGKRLVFYSDHTSDKSNQIFSLDLQSPRSVTQLTHDTGGVNDYDPAYMPDGSIISYKKSDRNGAYGDIWAMNKDGSNQHAVTTSLTAHQEEGWKPTPIDDSHVLITIRARQGDPHSDNLYNLDTRTGKPQQLTDNKFTNWFSTVNPRTHEVAFVSKPKGVGPDSIYTMQLNGKGRTALIRRSGDTDDPSWTPDGKHLLFISQDADGLYDAYGADADGGNAVLLDKSPKASDSEKGDLSPLALP